MSIAQERYDPARFTPSWIRHEHLGRFQFGATFVVGAIVVDAACGTGEGTRMFAEAGARHVYAFDIDPDAVARTARRCLGLDVTVSQADIASLPMDAATAEVFVSFETFEHLQHPERLLAEAHRVLKRGGKLICSTPNRDVYSPGNSSSSTPWNKFHSKEYSTAEFLTAIQGQFAECDVYGQNEVSRYRATLMQKISKSLPTIASVRVNQLTKLPRFILDKPENHAVRAVAQERVYEYSIIVGTKR